MAERRRSRKSSDDATPAQAAQPTAESTEPAIPKERLVTEARSWLGVSPHLAAGALHDADDELTVSDAKAKLRDYGVEDNG